MSKMSSRWVPKNLNVHNWHQRVVSCQELLDLYTSDKEKFGCRLVTGDETRIQHWDPESSKHTRIYAVEAHRLPPPKKFRTQPAPGKSYDNNLGDF